MAVAAVTETRWPAFVKTQWWKPALVIVALGVVGYVIVLLHLMTVTLLTMHGDMADMRDQLHRTNAALSTTNAALSATNAKLAVVNAHLVSTNRELQQTNAKLRLTNDKLGTTSAGVLAMRGDTGRMTAELRSLQSSLASMREDIHQMTHRIVHAKLLF